MPLSAGSRVGGYEVVSELGKGGMGEVYRARDIKLERDVAIKVLPISLAQDPERLARFEREAKVLAALNHPNIAQIYGIEESDGFRALVMELVQGETLAARIKRGPIPQNEALRFAHQIAEALEAAHDKSITHRDLKPANIMVTPDGVAKVLDFGLAVLPHRDRSDSGDPMNSPTLTMGGTAAGTILGTAAYMSPEQARGEVVDRRSDVWSYGVVLYELFTGQRAFMGDSISDILASVLKDQPDLSGIPQPARKLISRCLVKDRKLRMQAIGEARIMLDQPEPEAQAPVQPIRETASPKQSFTPKLERAAAAILLLSTLGVSYFHFREKPAPSPEPIRMQLDLPSPIAAATAVGISVSPNGRHLVFWKASGLAQQALWIRSLDSFDARPLPGTEAGGDRQVFWSPDSRFLAFQADGKLKRIDLISGSPLTICELPGSDQRMFGGTWTAGTGTNVTEGTILFGSTAGIMKVAASGGIPVAVTSTETPKNATASNAALGSHRFPVFLPDGKHFLYLRGLRIGAGDMEASISIGSTDLTPDRQLSTALVSSRFAPAFLADESGNGRLFFLRENTVWAQHFNSSKLILDGEPTSVAEGVGGNFGGYGWFSVSQQTLIFAKGEIAKDQLTWFDRDGKNVGTVAEPGNYNVLVLSPDGKKAALRTDDASGRGDIWVVDLLQGTRTRISTDPATETHPWFSPDGNRVAYGSVRDGVSGIYVKSASGVGEEEVLMRPSPGNAMAGWTRDGKFLLFFTLNAPSTTSNDIWLLPVGSETKPEDRKAFPFLQTPFSEAAQRLSPDNRWISYSSNISGRSEDYVQAFEPTPNAGSSSSSGKWLISKGGTVGAAEWRGDSKELFYIAPDGNMMSVEVSTVGGFKPSIPKPLFKVPASLMQRGGNTAAARMAVAPDGKRFLMSIPDAQSLRQEVSVVVNWQSLLAK